LHVARPALGNVDSSKRGTEWQGTIITNLIRYLRDGAYYIRVKVNGRLKYLSLETNVFSVAKLRLADAEKEMRTPHPSRVTGRRNPKTSVGRFIGAYLDRTRLDPALAPNSRLRREITVKAILKTWDGLADRDARGITPADCQSWAGKAFTEGTGFVAPNVRSIRRGMSVSAYNKCVDVLRAIFEIARDEGVVYKNPASSLSKRGTRRKRLDLPSSDQFQAIVSSISTTRARRSKDSADMVRFLAYSGARLREATALRWGDLDLGRNRLTIAGTKTESSNRTIPIFPPLAALLSEMRTRRGVESDSAPILRVQDCLGSLKSACRRVGIKALTHHDLRHLFATSCIESGVDIPTVSRWLGHSDGGNLAMKTYGHLRQEHSDAQAAKVRF
jgi:integrase